MGYIREIFNLMKKVPGHEYPSSTLSHDAAMA
jgi:hypothetical protein